MTSKTPVRVLFIEDSEDDAELEGRELRRSGLDIDVRRVETAEAIERALVEFRPDIILSDYSMPALTGIDALRLVRQHDADVPFIIVSGSIGEERAIETLKLGATDYVVKNRMGGLVARVQRALREAGERRQGRDLQRQLQAAQKLEAIGRLAGGIAHDFNNLLTIINGYAQLLGERVNQDADARMLVDEIGSAGRRAADLTRQLLTFGRRQRLAPVVVVLNKILEDMSKLLHRLIGEDVELDMKLQPGLAPVLADPGQLEQVVMNLAINARDAMPGGGRLTLTTSDVDVDEAAAARIEGLSPGPHVRLDVTDTGEGMRPDILERIFEPFFTTKPADKGTGLGLSTVYGIVRQSRGGIEVRSAVGAGTSFSVYLPRSAESPAVSAAAAPPAGASATNGAGHVVLVVEDAEAVRKYIGDVLHRHGFGVAAAANGRDALAMVEQGLAVDAVLTDVIMPHVGGVELARKLRESRPSLPVVFMTGYAGERAGADLPADAVVLAKPFPAPALVQALRNAVDRTR